MIPRSYSQLVRYKLWADHDLNKVIATSLDKIDIQDTGIILRILDHIHVVDKIFQHHLKALPHRFDAPHTAELRPFGELANAIADLDDWYVSYVDNLSASDFDQPIDFVFTNGTSACMRRGEIILHVCLHGTYHRGNAGVVLQKNGITPNTDRFTDFLELQP